MSLLHFLVAATARQNIVIVIYIILKLQQSLLLAAG